MTCDKTHSMLTTGNILQIRYENISVQIFAVLIENSKCDCLHQFVKILKVEGPYFIPKKKWNSFPTQVFKICRDQLEHFLTNFVDY